MKKPVNFEAITHTYYKSLGINWQIRIEENDSDSDGDFNRVWLIPDNVGEEQINRAFYFNIYWSKNICKVFVPRIGQGTIGINIKNYDINPLHMKTSDDFKSWLVWIVEDLMNSFKLNDETDLLPGFTPLSFLVKSDSSDTHYSVNYVNGDWSCTCPAFIYSKQLPQNCKHIDKIKK